MPGPGTVKRPLEPREGVYPDGGSTPTAMPGAPSGTGETGTPTMTATLSLPGEISLTLQNNADRQFMTNFYDWALYRWESGQWRHVAPLFVNQPLMTLEPGKSHTWTVTLSDGNREAPTFRASGTDEVTVEPVGGGHYAFAVDGWWEGQDETPAYEHQTVFAARFEAEGSQLPLVPSSAVTATRREGDTVVITAENPRGNDGTPATYVLTRDDAAPDPRELVTEQVYREWPLRGALAHADDASEVRVETTTGITPLFGVHAEDNPAVTYDGETSRIGAEKREG